MDTNIKRSYNEKVFEAYLTGEIDQHSVGMQYVKVEMAVNDPDFKEEFAAWNKYYPLIGNQKDAEEQGFFFAVKEAKLIEISAVLEGSNRLTNTLNNITPEIEPDNSTHESEPVPTKTINYTYLLTKLKSND
jgi:heme/copper-type cytochrome/quinol oxidase subunit 1